MSKRPLEVHPAAAAEARAARQWYAKRSTAAAEGFMRELDTAIQRIKDEPDRWPTYLRGTQRYLLRRYPYLVVYRATPESIQVIAVAHGRRRPGYWKNRR